MFFNKSVFLILSLFFIVTVYSRHEGQIMPGGLGEEHSEVDNPHVSQLVDTLSPNIKTMVEAKRGKPLELSNNGRLDIKVISYKSQVVAGTNYFVKVRITGEYWHLRIFEQTWTKTLELSSVSGPESLTSPIGYF